MSPELRAAVRRALADNPARAFADIAILFGIATELVADLAFDLLPAGERRALQRQVRRRLESEENAARALRGRQDRLVADLAAVGQELLAEARRLSQAREAVA